MILVCHSPRERCGVREYGQHLDSGLKALGAIVCPANYDTLHMLLSPRVVPFKVLLVHLEEQLVHPLDRFTKNLRTARQKGMKVVLICHWYEHGYIDQFAGLFDKLVLHREYSPRHSDAAIVPLGCPVYEPTKLREKVRQNYGIPTDRVVVTTIGLLATWKRIPEVASAMIDAFRAHEQLHLHVHAPKPFDSTEMTAESQRVHDVIDGRTNASFSSEFLSREAALNLAWSSDLGYTFHPINTTGVSAATKQFVSSRTPLVATRSTHSSDLTQGVLRVDTVDPSTFARETASLAIDASRLASMRKEMEVEYDRINMNTVAKSYLEIFRSLQ
jgi:hypothetical protein